MHLLGCPTSPCLKGSPTKSLTADPTHKRSVPAAWAWSRDDALDTSPLKSRDNYASHRRPSGSAASHPIRVIDACCKETRRTVMQFLPARPFCDFCDLCPRIAVLFRLNCMENTE
jgi:hypothetical protein